MPVHWPFILNFSWQDGCTALDCAMDEEHTNIVNLLQQYRQTQ